MGMIDDPKILDQIYDVAIDPERLGSLLESWENVNLAGEGISSLFGGPSIESHFERASILLDRWQESQNREIYRMVLEPFSRAAAFSVDSGLKVCATNDTAREHLGLQDGATLAGLALDAEDIANLENELGRILHGAEANISTFRFFSRQTGRNVIFRIRPAYDPMIGPFAIVATSDVGWPDNFDSLLSSSFGLSVAEVEVLRAVVECRSLRDIATQRERSLETIRAQVRAIMSKTEAHSQAELVRMVLALLDLAENTNTKSTAPDLDGQTLIPLDPRSLRRPDGRRLDYMVTGDENGRPCLFLPTDYCIVRWPARIEEHARKHKIKVIAPIRGGYGDSDLYHKKADLESEIRQDIKAILDMEGVQRCPVIAFGTDSYFAFSFAKRFPEMVAGIILCDAFLPLSTPEQYKRMDKWYRFIMANARYAPHLLPFMVKAGMLLARKVGKRRFVEMVMGNSPSDMEVLKDPQAFEALATGSENTLSETKNAYLPFTAEAILQNNTDWKPNVLAAQDRIAVHALFGTESQTIAPETLAEFRQEYTWMDIREYKDTGSLLFYKHWREVLDMLEKYLD